MIVFCFQAEDGIRDVAVTGVQTCALPIYRGPPPAARWRPRGTACATAPPLQDSPSRRRLPAWAILDRKSTRLNSSHGYISYAVFCLKKKKAPVTDHTTTDVTLLERGV